MTAGIWSRVFTRRGVVFGGAALSASAIAENVRSSRRVRCALFPPLHPKGGEARGMTGHEDVFPPGRLGECHASTLAATRSGLVCAWFAGTREGAADVAIWASRREGGGWSEPAMLFRGTGERGEALACWNPVLWASPSGGVFLFYKVGASPRSWWGMVSRSGDGGRSWGAPARLPDGILGPVKNKPLLLPDGRLLCPSSTEHDGWRVHFEWTADQGRSWERTGPIGGGRRLDIIQPTLLTHPGQRLQALCRSRQGRAAELWSEDGGRSWSAPTLTGLANPNSGIDAVTLGDGRYILAHNPVWRCRSPLVLSVSEDGGTWRRIATLEDGRGEFSYPAIIQDGGGKVHVSYTNRRRSITHVTIDPQEI